MNKQAGASFVQALQALLGETAVQRDVLMSRYTTLRLGGPADFFWEADASERLEQVLTLAHQWHMPVVLLGNGSNFLVRDGGIRGLVIHIGNGLNTISAPVPLSNGRFAMTAGGGTMLTRLSMAAAEHGLAGLAFAAGIPGTVGGAVAMNAGAYGGEMKDVITAVTAVDMAGKMHRWTNADMAFGYRKSRAHRADAQAAIVEVALELEASLPDVIRAEIRELNARRREKQPLSQPSCGSTFMRPEGHFAGALIEKCGLKGFRIGGASVSELHAGFLLNDQGGTAADFLALMAHVQRVVLEETGVTLQPEVSILGEDVPA